MSAMKAFAEAVSVELGYDGEINDHVLEVADSRLKGEDDDDTIETCAA